MSTTKFVVRLLSSDDALLAWAEVHAMPKPQRSMASCPFWPIQPTKFLIERDGEVAKMAVHWADLDVARVREMQPTGVTAGQVYDFLWLEPIWLVPGMRDVPLPGVTIRAPTTVGVPVGNLTALSPR